MFDWSQAIMKEVVVHHLDHGENPSLTISESLLRIDDSWTEGLLQEYFLNGLKEKPDLYNFTYNGGAAELNPVNQLVTLILKQEESLLDASKHIAKLLFQKSNHPNIKSGDLYVVLFDHIMHEDEVINAIGLFKSETKDDFLKLRQQENLFSISHDIGLSIKKLDKGCLIYDTPLDDSYVISIIDRSNTTTEAQFWKNDFLQLKPREDAYHQTLQYMNLTQSYLGHQLTEDIEINRADQIDLINRTGQYFKENDSFQTEDFKYRVLQDPTVIQSFDKFQDAYQSELNIELPEQYSISPKAVQRGARNFKSVLKLDKNFHIYIHGDRSKIQSGHDPDGRKWYKIYYDEEH